VPTTGSVKPPGIAEATVSIAFASSDSRLSRRPITSRTPSGRFSATPSAVPIH